VIHLPLLLASYLRPRTLPIPGFDLENVFLLRDPSQANKIAEMGAGKNVVVIGTSFIGTRDSIIITILIF
jgi:NAD(P)H-nitrite reductase large subunit